MFKAMLFIVACQPSLGCTHVNPVYWEGGYEVVEECERVSDAMIEEGHDTYCVIQDIL